MLLMKDCKKDIIFLKKAQFLAGFFLIQACLTLLDLCFMAYQPLYVIWF